MLKIPFLFCLNFRHIKFLKFTIRFIHRVMNFQIKQLNCVFKLILLYLALFAVFIQPTQQQFSYSANWGIKRKDKFF